MKVILAYKSFEGVCHKGLGVCAMHVSNSLNQAGIPSQVWQVKDGFEIVKKLQSDPDVTHFVQSAPFIHTDFVEQEMVKAFPHVKFTITCHSNIAFLQADSMAGLWVPEELAMGQRNHNFDLSGNSRKFCTSMERAYGGNCVFLPNLYPSDFVAPRGAFTGSTLRVGIFGATRPLKNLMSAAVAALMMSRQLRVELETWVSGGRNEGGGGLLASVRNMYSAAPHAKLVESPWQEWSDFRKTCGRMHLMLQPSFTESFNIVTADGIAEGVASVVSPAIDWAPKHWMANPDEPAHIADVGLKLLKQRNAAADGQKALAKYTKVGLDAWRKWIG